MSLATLTPEGSGGLGDHTPNRTQSRLDSNDQSTKAVPSVCLSCGSILSRYGAYMTGADKDQRCAPCRGGDDLGMAALEAVLEEWESIPETDEDEAEMERQRIEWILARGSARSCECERPIPDGEGDCLLCGRSV